MMRPALLFSLCILNFVSGIAQVGPTSDFIVRIVGQDTILVEMPQLHGFPPPRVRGGLDSFFRKHMRYPEEARRKNIEGDVALMYFIRPDGTMDSISVIESVSPDIDLEAIRLITLLPRWKPPMTDGRKIGVWMMTTVPFRINK